VSLPRVSGVTSSLPSEADVIVVGAGAAGCVVAARLSGDPECSVLLLEAGGDHDPAAVGTPGRRRSLWTSPLAYEDVTVAQTELNGRQIVLPTGRGVGGGSAINGLAWLQGHPADYDGWRDQGALGWAWSGLRPYLRRIEDHELGSDEFHDAGGPMAVSFPRDVHPVAAAFVRAGAADGLTVSDDLNGEIREGVGFNQANIRDGARHDVVDGYLRPAEARANLIIRSGARVDQIVTHGSAAIGVRVAGTRDTVRARRAVILSAGAIRTPQVLQLSGIGAANQLRSLGIAVVADLPGVGQGLQDHVLVPTIWPLRADITRSPFDEDPELAYQTLRRGPLASTVPALAVLRSSSELSAPDLQLAVSPTGSAPPNDRGPTVVGNVALLAPRSRGTVRLASADPDAPPLIDPGYLQEPADRSTLVAGLRRLRAIFEAPPMRALVGPCEQPDRDGWADDRALLEFAAGHAGPYWHVAGTARMGSDDLSVVDSSLAVHGVENLYVIDASVMPTIPRANTHATTIAVAERAADLLTRAWSSGTSPTPSQAGYE
jgi:choline dehydrogenase